MSDTHHCRVTGEPINPEAWRWYNENVGGGKCTVVDTYWQTETGAHIAANLPGASFVIIGIDGSFCVVLVDFSSFYYPVIGSVRSVTY